MYTCNDLNLQGSFMHKKDREAFQKFSEGYIFKVLGLGFVTLLLLIPLNMISGLVRERSHTAREAESNIMEAWGSQLIGAGPIITIPGVRTITSRTRTEKEGEKIETREEQFTLIITPKNLNINANFNTEVRYRGIFSVPLFSGKLNISGSFDPSRAIASKAANERLFFNQAELNILLSNQKGIRKINYARWNKRNLFFQPNIRTSDLLRENSLSNGISATLPTMTVQEAVFDISIDIQGGQSVQFLPLGQDTQVIISADWDSPSFQGAFLPVSRNITDKSFTAQWNISYLSRNIPLFWKDTAGNRTTNRLSSSLFGVDLFRQIDTYALNTRAVKYGVLFLIIPFLALFLMEIFAKRRIHPVPYLLSGIGNIIFYLLLLSFSEQMPFFPAYSISAFSVAVMMTLYSRALLGTWRKSWYMGLVMSLSYVLLYAVLNAESYALLIGSIGAFAVTALIMYLTRKLEWYGNK